VSWVLSFYRRIGQGTLQRHELETFFTAREDCRREVVDLAGADAVAFTFAHSAPPTEFLFVLTPASDGPDAQAGAISDPDFPFELAPLQLHGEPLQPEIVATRASAVAVEVGEQLRLLCREEACEEGPPSAPELGPLCRRYLQYDSSVRSTVAAAAAQKRKFMLIGFVILALYAIMAVASAHR
jgi:hypothetical protein